MDNYKTKVTTMNAKHNNEELAGDQIITNRCLQSCKKLLARIEQVKTKIAKEYQVHGHALQLALNEAEALAWQTDYPHLLFPALAFEKVQAAVAWQTRQQSVRRQQPRFFAEAA
jgi:hypothetical protein